MGVLAFITLLYILIVSIYCCKGKKYKDDDTDDLPSYKPKNSKRSPASKARPFAKKGSKDSKVSKTSQAQDKSKGDSKTETEETKQ